MHVVWKSIDRFAASSQAFMCQLRPFKREAAPCEFLNQSTILLELTCELTSMSSLCRGVKLPSRRPALVCESCLYSQDAQSRVRAFHVLDPRGLLDVIGVFHESRDGNALAELQHSSVEEPSKRVEALLGTWSGQLVSRRTGIYGATLAANEVQVLIERDENGNVKQVPYPSTSTLLFPSFCVSEFPARKEKVPRLLSLAQICFQAVVTL